MCEIGRLAERLSCMPRNPQLDPLAPRSLARPDAGPRSHQQRWLRDMCRLRVFRPRRSISLRPTSLRAGHASCRPQPSSHSPTPPPHSRDVASPFPMATWRRLTCATHSMTCSSRLRPYHSCTPRSCSDSHPDSQVTRLFLVHASRLSANPPLHTLGG
jgi:hypothetical protein